MTAADTITAAARELAEQYTLPWHCDHDEMCRLARWLVKNEGYDVEQLLGYVESPWKWGDEYAAMVAAEIV